MHNRDVIDTRKDEWVVGDAGATLLPEELHVADGLAGSKFLGHLVCIPRPDKLDNPAQRQAVRQNGGNNQDDAFFRLAEI